MTAGIQTIIYPVGDLDRPKALVTTAGRGYLFISFTIGMVTKFWPGPTFFGPAYAEKFIDWGWAAWMRFVVGAIEGVCALLLIVPRRRTRFIGATALVFVLVGAVTTHLIDEAPLYEEVSASLHLVILTMVALANWPPDWRDLLRPWELDHGRSVAT